MNIALITGASSGLGLEFAKQIDNMSEEIDEIWLISRRKDRLISLAENLKHPVKILALNLMDEADIALLESKLKEEQPNIKFLVNSAGFGILGYFEKSNIKEQLEMIQLNCSVLTQVTFLALPYMKENSRIMQIASSAAFLPQRNFAVYAASKSYVLSFSYGLGAELEKRKIYVTAICPGPVQTEFFDRAEKNGSILKIKQFIMAKPEKVVKKALKDSLKRKGKSVYGAPIKYIEVISKLLPYKSLLFFMKFMK